MSPVATAQKPVEHANLAAALAAFQENLPKIGKANTANTGTYSYKYADLSEINAAVLPALAAQGLSWTTKPTMDDQGRFVLAYKLAHVSGGCEEGVYPLGNPGQAQAMGSAITYARRYCICAVTGVAPDEDDDGAAATQHARNAEQQAPPDPAVVEREELLARIAVVADAANIPRARLAELFAQDHDGRHIRTATPAELLLVLHDLEAPDTTVGAA